MTSSILALIERFIHWLYPVSTDHQTDVILTTESTPEAPVVPTAPPITETAPPTPSELLWDTVANAKHSVRVICDEEGLSWKDKNDLCATVGAESGWQSYYLSGPKKGLPVIRKNYDKKGVWWSTDWGIAQINDYFHIKEGSILPSHEYVLDNPETSIRWMCRRWLEGKSHWWVAFNDGSYKANL